MSFVQKQQKAFAASTQSAAARFAKKVITSNSSTPSTPPSSQQSQSKPRAPDSSQPAVMAKQVFSQPADTGTGDSIQTNMVYAITLLKDNMGKALTLQRIVEFLNLHNKEASYREAVGQILRNHTQVTYDAKARTYKFRPKHDIASADDLLSALQKLTTFKGIDVKELKEGWPSAEKVINELDAEHKVNVIRFKKDQAPKLVFANDPSLYMKVDEEFDVMFHQIRVPDDHQELMNEVKALKQTTANKSGKKPAQNVAKVEKPKKKIRRGGKTTNKHMQGIFKDFSYMQR